MSKVQLLYEKIMKIMFAFTGIFFVLFIIILFFAMSAGAIDCTTSVVCKINDGSGFYTFTVYPLGVGTIVFIVLGRVFYSLAYKERKLLTVEEYKADQQRKALERLKQLRKQEAKEQYQAERTQAVEEVDVPDVEILNDETAQEEVEFVRKAGPLTKTRLITYISEQQKISLIDARGFVNALFKVATIRLNNDDCVDFEGFGILDKINIEDEGTDIEFFPYGELSEALELEPFEYETFSVPKSKPKQTKKQEERAHLLDEVKKKEARDNMIEEVKKKVTLKKKPKRNKISKKDIIERIAEEHDISKNKADKFLKGLTDVIRDTLISRDDVVIDAFGKFTTIEMPAKKAVNPQTQESIVVPAHHQVRLRFNTQFEDDIKE